MTADGWAATGRPGGSAEERYHQLHRAWWRRMRRQVRKFAAFWVVAFVVPSAVGAYFLHRGLWWFDAGLFVGALGAIVIGVKENPPEHIERLMTGFQGEQQTAKALADMSGLTVFHDLDGGRAGGNVDHIAVGAAGVFLIDSKWLVGTAEVNGDEVRVRRYEDPELSYLAEGIGPRMRRMARAFHDRLRQSTRASIWVQPVVVFWGEFDAGVAEAHGVVYVQGERLRGWLESRPVRYTEPHVRSLSTAIASF